MVKNIPGENSTIPDSFLLPVESIPLVVSMFCVGQGEREEPGVASCSKAQQISSWSFTISKCRSSAIEFCLWLRALCTAVLFSPGVSAQEGRFPTNQTCSGTPLSEIAILAAKKYFPSEDVCCGAITPANQYQLWGRFS